mgnify:CR=1 FL=1
MAVRGAKAVFVGNIKGGVGKSTLTVYLTEYLRQRFKRQGVLLIDTDPQGTAFELLEPRSRTGEARFLPVGDRYDLSLIHISETTRLLIIAYGVVGE